MNLVVIYLPPPYICDIFSYVQINLFVYHHCGILYSTLRQCYDIINLTLIDLIDLGCFKLSTISLFSLFRCCKKCYYIFIHLHICEDFPRAYATNEMAESKGPWIFFKWFLNFFVQWLYFNGFLIGYWWCENNIDFYILFLHLTNLTHFINLWISLLILLDFYVDSYFVCKCGQFFGLHTSYFHGVVVLLWPLVWCWIKGMSTGFFFLGWIGFPWRFHC